ncbi:MAG TPA: hypothetical protein VFS75_03190, partial [Candidatus Paceibacterota bacterium]|nr:hypothetical protein [Candidatus Paceibacterota bacterium]
MRILFISNELGGSGLCQKLIEEGNDLKLYIHRPEWQACYQGLAARVANWRHELNWVGKDGLIIFDDVFFGREQGELRKDGYKVVGGSEGGDALELDRRHFQ